MVRIYVTVLDDMLIFSVRSLSWNCSGINLLHHDVKALCKDYDVIFIPEHWLHNDELN